MGLPGPEKSVKLFAGILAPDEAHLHLARRALESRWGAIDHASDTIPFDFTAYYAPEMGLNLLRCWVSFRDLRSPAGLAALKRGANDLERQFAIDGKRRVNIDPGYATSAKVVLASTKDYSHRIYLADGIFAELTMMYQKGAWTFLPWTYPDYRSPAALAFFSTIRTG